MRLDSSSVCVERGEATLLFFFSFRLPFSSPGFFGGSSVLRGGTGGEWRGGEIGRRRRSIKYNENCKNGNEETECSRGMQVGGKKTGEARKKIIRKRK